MHENGSQKINVLTRALARGTVVNLTGFAVRVMLVFLHSFIGARVFGAKAYGVYAIGVAAVSLLSLVGQVGLGRTLTRFVALYHARNEPEHIVGTLKLTLRIAVPVSVGIGLVLGIGAEPMARLFGESALVSSFRILGFAVLALTLATLLAAFTQGFQRMRDKAIALDMVGPGVEVLGLVILAWLGAKRLGLPIAYTLSVLASAALLVYYVRLDLRRLGEALPDSAAVSPATPLKPVLGFAVPVWAVNILIEVTRRVSVLMLGVMGTSAMVGVFSILQRLVALGTTFLVSLNFMFGPMVADLVERQQLDELARLYKVSTRWMLAVGLPFFVVLGFFGAEILQLFGPEFVGGSNALWYLVVAMIYNVSTGSCGMILMMSGRPQYSVINEAIMLLTVAGLNLWFIPQYGLLGAAWAFAAGTVVSNALRVVQVWWHLRIHPYSESYLKVIMAGVAMSAALWAWKAYVPQGKSSLLVLGLGGVITLLIYAIVLIALGLEEDEVEMLRTVQRRLMRTRAAVD